MKRKNIIYLFCVVCIFGAAASFLFQDRKEEKTLSKISLAEVAHTVFYAPMYVAIENHYFEQNGLDVDVVLANGADKVASALLSNDVQIGLSGAEATIYVYNGGEKNYLKTFSQLTQKDGSFLVSRQKTKSFSLNDLKGKTVMVEGLRECLK